jgi:imidazoleglycerol-phosphate dehydratase/histidinol-phosphatase
LTKYIYGAYDLKNSFVIGDRVSDIQLAKNLGCQGVFIGNENDQAILSTEDWNEIYGYLKSRPRIAEVNRKTKETNINLAINLDGEGRSDIDTGLGFLDHMLEQICKHGQVDLSVKVEGDLEVDEHHTVEDVAIVLGQSFRKALGSKKGIMRYGFILPMDDCLSQVAIDFGGRPWFKWKAKFKREKIGDVPTELFSHFFKSFSDAAQCNLNIKAKGKNEHHKIESVFKAFAKAVFMAKNKVSNNIPSTKGSI